jgi:glycosyltransferase involved in cell wall biosynthesis
MACGNAVVGSNVSGIKDIIKHEGNGILVPPRDPAALADAILTLLKDENLRKFLGQNARELMVKNYNWDKITDKLEEVYCKAVAKTK